MTIIPAIDIMNGKCVRLTHGDFAKQQIYYDDPVAAAVQFEKAGFTRLHLVDLDGARTGKMTNLAVLKNVASNTGLLIDFGGGVKSLEDVEAVFSAGANMVTIGSIAVRQPRMLEQWLNSYGRDRFLVGTDVLDEKIKISGWQEDGGIGIFDFIDQLIAMGLTELFCTDISKDGALEGPAIHLYTKIIARYPTLGVIASGGASNLDDVLALQKIGCSGVIIGKAIYEGRIALADLTNLNS